MSDDEQAGGAADDAPEKPAGGRSSDADDKKADDKRSGDRKAGDRKAGDKKAGDDKKQAKDGKKQARDDKSRDDEGEDDDEKSAEDEAEDEEDEREKERERAAGRFKAYTRDPLAEDQGEDGPTDLAAAARTRRATRLLFDVGRDLHRFDRSYFNNAHIGDINLRLGARRFGAGMRSGPVPEDELRRLRRAHVEPEGYVRLRTALRARRLLVLGAAPGTGRTSTALSLLDEVTTSAANGTGTGTGPDAEPRPAPGCSGSIRTAGYGSWPRRWTSRGAVRARRRGPASGICWSCPSPGPERCPRTRWTSTSSPPPWPAARPSR